MEFRIALTMKMSSTVIRDGVRLILNGCAPRKKGALRKNLLQMVTPQQHIWKLHIHKCKETNAWKTKTRTTFSTFINAIKRIIMSAQRQMSHFKKSTSSMIQCRYSKTCIFKMLLLCKMVNRRTLIHHNITATKYPLLTNQLQTWLCTTNRINENIVSANERAYLWYLGLEMRSSFWLRVTPYT